MNESEKLLEKLRDYAKQYKDVPIAGDALMYFLRGDCKHCLLNDKLQCALCNHQFRNPGGSEFKGY